MTSRDLLFTSSHHLLCLHDAQAFLDLFSVFFARSKKVPRWSLILCHFNVPSSLVQQNRKRSPLHVESFFELNSSGNLPADNSYPNPIIGGVSRSVQNQWALVESPEIGRPPHPSNIDRLVVNRSNLRAQAARNSIPSSDTVNPPYLLLHFE